MKNIKVNALGKLNKLYFNKLDEIYKNMEFFPTLKNFLNESSNLVKTPANAKPKAIDEFDKIKAMDGEIIDMTILENEMDSARTAIVAQAPLFANFVNKFFPIYTWRVDTMATDGYRLFVNPQFANNLEWRQKIFVLLHEIYHCILMHIDRGQKLLNKPLINIAGDYEINALLVEAFPKYFSKEFVLELKGLYDERFLPYALEEIYKILEDEGFKPPHKQPNDLEPPKPPKINKHPGKSPLHIGQEVRVKSTGERAKVTIINSDGTFEVNIIDESLSESLNENYFKLLTNFLNESYTRDELIPIQKVGEGSDGEGPESPEIEIYEDDEIEIEGTVEAGDVEETPTWDDPRKIISKVKVVPTQGIKKPNPKQKQKGKGSDEDPLSEKDETQEESDYATALSNDFDPTSLGGIIPKKVADDIAEKEGFEETSGPGSGINKNDIEKIFKELSKYRDDSANGSGGKNKAGGGFSGLRKKLSKIIRGEANWKELFKKFVGRALSPERETYMGNKKYLWQGAYREDRRTKQDAMNKIIVAIDASGSMYSIPRFMSRILGEVNEIIFTKRAKEVTTAFFTSILHEDTVETIKRASKTNPFIPKVIPGQGGTDFRTIFDWIKRKFRDSVQLLVIITDGQDQIPAPPKYKNNIIWLVYDSPNWTVPYGKIVHIESTSSDSTE